MKIHNVEQGTDEWLELRKGIVTASEFKKLVTSTGKIANNATSRGYVIEKALERITGRIEPEFVSYDMMRGTMEEPLAIDLYSKHFAPVTPCGFMTTNDGKIGYSPDSLVGEDGLIEVKSAKARIQAERIIENVLPSEHFEQIQVGLFVSGRKWCDFISYSNGMPLFVKRVLPDLEFFKLIEDVKIAFELNVKAIIEQYNEASKGMPIAPYIEPISDEIEL